MTLQIRNQATGQDSMHVSFPGFIRILVKQIAAF